MSFEITFLGSSGGPVEGTTCSIMIKPRKVSYQDILTKKLYHQLITIDAGSGLAQLTETIYNEIHTLGDFESCDIFIKALNNEVFAKGSG